MPLTQDPTYPFLSQMPCVAEPKATFLIFAEPCALWNLTRPSAFFLFLLNFLRLSPTSLPPLPLAQTKFLFYTKAPSSLWHEFSSLHLQSFLDVAFCSFHLEEIYYSHPEDGKASRLSCFLQAYFSHLLCLKAF